MVNNVGLSLSLSPPPYLNEIEYAIRTLQIQSTPYGQNAPQASLSIIYSWAFPSWTMLNVATLTPPPQLDEILFFVSVIIIIIILMMAQRLKIVISECTYWHTSATPCPGGHVLIAISSGVQRKRSIEV